jgi:phosphoglycolate phosphatase-like HAD superfamily hydrolase
MRYEWSSEERPFFRQPGSTVMTGGFAVALALFVIAGVANPTHPLGSWTDTAAKRAIISFVEKTTRQGSSDLVPVADRIAVFDNDGTLWAEAPVFFEYAFAADRIKALAPAHPEWRGKEPFASLINGDIRGALARGGKDGIGEALAASHSGLTTEEFETVVRNWVDTARHQQTGRLYTEMTYQPMLELLAYLRENSFKTYIVSGGGVEFMRVFAERVYGIPPEQVIGTSGKQRFEQRAGVPVLMKLPELDHLDDGPGKPVAIQKHIGRRPIAAFGNSDGDLEMLQWTFAGGGQRFALLVHHDDADREWAYEHDALPSRLEKGLVEAKAKGWTVVSMRGDWKTVFPPR